MIHKQNTSEPLIILPPTIKTVRMKQRSRQSRARHKKHTRNIHQLSIRNLKRPRWRGRTKHCVGRPRPNIEQLNNATAALVVLLVD